MEITSAHLNNPQMDMDWSGACPRCSAGARPIPPMSMSSFKMGKKRIDLTGYAHLLILERSLAEELDAAGLSGLTHHPIRVGRDADSFVWSEVQHTLPPAEPGSVLDRRGRCDRCGRGGHALRASRRDGRTVVTPLSLTYTAAALAGARDVNDGGERFFPLGGAAGGGYAPLVISARAQAFFAACGLRHLSFREISIV